MTKLQLVFDEDKCGSEGIIGVFDTTLDAKVAIAEYVLDNPGNVEMKILEITMGEVLK